MDQNAQDALDDLLLGTPSHPLFSEPLPEGISRTMNPVSTEPIFDEKLSPLLTQIHDIAAAAGMPFLMFFQLTPDANPLVVSDGYLPIDAIPALFRVLEIWMNK